MHSEDDNNKEYQAIGLKEIFAIVFAVAGIAWIFFH
jgi:hypothetical protein